MRITRIEPQKKRPGRKNVYADDQFIAGVSDETLLRLAIRAGDEIGPDVLKALQQTEELFHAKSAALRLLGVRPRTEREIRDRLREKEFSDEEISQAIDDLKKASLLDDRAFAQMYIRDALTLKPVGRSVIRRKLLLLGVERSIVDESLEEGFAGVDLRATVEELARQFLKKAGTTQRKQDPRRLRARLSAYLLRRGYTWDVAGPTVKSLTADLDQEGESE
jgi:regulatory protein